jgi:hypothetical protein
VGRIKSQKASMRLTSIANAYCLGIPQARRGMAPYAIKQCAIAIGSCADTRRHISGFSPNVDRVAKAKGNLGHTGGMDE